MLVFTWCLALAAWCTAQAVSDAAPRVTLDSGIHEGLVRRSSNGNIVHQYLGIPFAASPTRFRPPEPVQTAVERRVLPAKYPPACVQATNSSGRESEDCLFLNIFVPEPGTRNDRAVMVFLYGGALQYGSASLEMYDGTSFAANQDVVIVVPNYRTNVFGFPGVAPMIPVQERNLGFLDQRMAFNFVQRHISKFGGDANKVTVFGQSAGARSADFHLLTMKKPPFRAVIMESGSSELLPLADRHRISRNTSHIPPLIRLATSLSCTSPDTLIDCLRNVTASKIKQAILEQHLYYPSTFDNNLTTVEDQLATRRDGLAANVSLLMGSNSDEQTMVLKEENHTSFDEYLNSTFYSSTRKKLKTHYAFGPNQTHATEFDAMSAIETDFSYTCLTSRESWISSLSRHRKWIQGVDLASS